MLPFTPFRIFYTRHSCKHGGVLWVTYKTLGSVHLVKQSSSMSSSSSKIFSNESLKTLMSVSNSDKLTVAQRGGNFRDGQNKRWRSSCTPGDGVFMAADVSDYVLYLLLFWSSTCSLLLSAERILGSTRDSKVSIMTGSTSFSQACKELTYHIKAHSCYLLGQKYFFISENKVSLNLDQKLKYRQCFSYLTLCCSMASRALNSKGKECVCDASWEARSSTSQRSKPRPRKSNTSSDWGVTIAFRVWKVTY